MMFYLTNTIECSIITVTKKEHVYDNDFIIMAV
jgi:hypothetical protein